MNPKQFESELDEILTQTKDVLASKSKEYSKESDKHYNFKRAAQIINKTPETALWGMYIKHFTSVQDIVEKIEETGETPRLEILAEKFGDSINYMILLYTLIKERIENDKIQ